MCESLFIIHVLHWLLLAALTSQIAIAISTKSIEDAAKHEAELREKVLPFSCMLHALSLVSTRLIPSH